MESWVKCKARTYLSCVVCRHAWCRRLCLVAGGRTVVGTSSFGRVGVEEGYGVDGLSVGWEMYVRVSGWVGDWTRGKGTRGSARSGNAQPRHTRCALPRRNQRLGQGPTTPTAHGPQKGACASYPAEDLAQFVSVAAWHTPHTTRLAHFLRAHAHHHHHHHHRTTRKTPAPRS